MLKYFYSLFSSKKENKTINTLIYESLSTEQKIKLHKKYNLIIVVKKVK